MRKVLKTALVTIILIPIVLAASACAPREIQSRDHFFALSFGNTLANFPLDQYFEEYSYMSSNIIVFSDKESLRDFFSETYSRAWSPEELRHVRDDVFTNLITGFDEEFFKYNQLVTFVVAASTTAHRFELVETIYQRGVLTMSLEHFSDGVGGDAISNWFGMVEVASAPSGTRVEIQINNRGW